MGNWIIRVTSRGVNIGQLDNPSYEYRGEGWELDNPSCEYRGVKVGQLDKPRVNIDNSIIRITCTSCMLTR